MTVKAVDDYDPHPEVVFDSIQDVTHKSVGTSPFATANYALNIPNNPSKGLYPTSITFTASPMEVKKYLIKYKVTDASSNETILSTMVSIPKL